MSCSVYSISTQTESLFEVVKVYEFEEGISQKCTGTVKFIKGIKFLC